MTDRSSEERSRVNDALLKISAIALRGLPPKTGYIFYVDEVRQIIQELLAAALEDRQEAAPEAPLARCALCGGTQFDHFQGGYDHNFMWPGVPSEATPSKENAPPRHAMSQGMEFWKPAPAPEVQGTPTGEPWYCQICGGSSVPCEHWTPQEIARVTSIREAPVGTPQKEIPKP